MEEEEKEGERFIQPPCTALGFMVVFIINDQNWAKIIIGPKSDYTQKISIKWLIHQCTICAGYYTADD